MDEKDKSAFLNDFKTYNYLKDNSWAIKHLNRRVLDYHTFIGEMKKNNHERVSDKIDKTIDNMEIITSILDIFQ